MQAAGKRKGRQRLRRLLGLAALLPAVSGTGPAAAQDVAARAGDWDYGSDGVMAAASTRNAEGAMFGLVCSPNCIGYVNDDRPCDQDATYDATMSSPGRADALRMQCRRTEAGYALLFTPSEAFVSTLRNGPEVTITVRRSGDTDREYRFSLNGAYDAVYMTLATAIAISGDRPEPESHGL